MLFNSYLYIFIFLPLALTSYFLCAHYFKSEASTSALILFGLVFYSYWEWHAIYILLFSIFINYALGRYLQKQQSHRCIVLVTGITFNLCLLGYYKYYHFFIENVNFLLHAQIPSLDIILPLGISFFTFTQIAYLVDSYHNKVHENGFKNYFLFVTFFPHLLAGPIIHHAEMMPQFSSTSAKKVQWENIYSGLCLFSMGLFKKAVIADFLAFYVNSLYQNANSGFLGFWDSWVAALGYTCQLYFDFSGYTDMAIGAALLFNIILPENFRSPYKATSVQDFWRRWHMTLSRFLRDYIYIPLGGNRKNVWRTDLNVILVFLIGGLWHGAGWTFVLWGFLHGLGYLIQRIWKQFTWQLPIWVCILITFIFINCTWVFFRSPTFGVAFSILQSMLGLHGRGQFNPIILICCFIALSCMVLPNSTQIVHYIKNKGLVYFILPESLLISGVVAINLIPNTPFIYFQF